MSPTVQDILVSDIQEMKKTQLALSNLVSAHVAEEHQTLALIDEIRLDIKEHRRLLADQHLVLSEHMRRTEASEARLEAVEERMAAWEARVEPLMKSHYVWGVVGKVVVWVLGGSGVAAAAAIGKLFGKW